MVEESINRKLEQLSVAELERLSSGQQQALKMQKQQMLTKEDRLKVLMNQFHRHEQKLDNLRHIRSCLQSQESRLRDLHQMKLQLDRQTASKNQLSDELERTKALFAAREKELAEAVAKVDILTQQLDRTRAHTMFLRPSDTNSEWGKNSHAQSYPVLPPSGLEPPISNDENLDINRLRQEQTYRSRILHQQKRKLDDKDTMLLNKTLHRNELDQRINEIASRLHKRRIVSSNEPPSRLANGGFVDARLRRQLQEKEENLGQNVEGNVQMDKRNDAEKSSGSHSASPLSQNISGEPGDDRRRAMSGQAKMIMDRPDIQVTEDTVAPAGVSAANGSHSRGRALIQKRAHASNSGAAFSKEESVSVSDDSAIGMKSQAGNSLGSGNLSTRPDMVCREKHNLPNIVTDTLLAGDQEQNREYSPRSSDTPDISSASSMSETLPPAASSSSDGHGTKPVDKYWNSRPVLQAVDNLSAQSNEGKEDSGNLATDPAGSSANVRRVKFDPQALLLDASLEGELELVVKTCQQVLDPSACNDEGITALHNAICAGHFPIVKFLVEYGCDVNAQDSDGWSPLHCAASCNNLDMCRFLIEHGACVYSTTNSDQETAAEKCEEDEADYEACSRYLLDSLQNLGRVNGGIVYPVYSYEGQNSDELSFQCGDRVKILRTSDDEETEWYWAELVPDEGPSSKSTQSKKKEKTKQGYVPRNLLALHPRIQRS